MKRLTIHSRIQCDSVCNCALQCPLHRTAAVFPNQTFPQAVMLTVYFVCFLLSKIPIRFPQPLPSCSLAAWESTSSLHHNYYALLFINHIHDAFELHSNQNCELGQKMWQPCHFISAASLLFQYHSDLQE